eukprot:6002410-Pyramimonas_sp.AAC.1
MSSKGKHPKRSKVTVDFPFEGDPSATPAYVPRVSCNELCPRQEEQRVAARASFLLRAACFDLPPRPASASSAP